ncbi:MAG: histidine kinase [Microbacterium sp.]
MTRRRSSPPETEDELRLPRPPGVIRRFWARHPVATDILLTAGCVLLAVLTTILDAVYPPTPDGLAVGAVVSIASCLALLWRRRWPVAVLVVTLLPALVAPAVASGVVAPAPVIALYSVAVYRSSRATWWALGASATGVWLVSAGWALAGSPSEAANNGAGVVLFLVIGALVGVNVGNRKRYVAALIDRSRQLAVERDQQAQLAAGAERARIAREMHDIVSHSLTVIVALSEGATATADADRARAAMAQTARTARGALTEMRAMLGVLRDDSAAPLLPLDVDPVQAAVDSARRAGFPVALRVTTSDGQHRELPRAVRLAVGRIVQEGLTNAMRHAPRATAIDVEVSTDAAAVTVEVRNDAAGSAGGPGGYGLRGLRERVDHVGGAIDAGPAGTDGWRLRARLPVPPSTPANDATNGDT